MSFEPAQFEPPAIQVFEEEVIPEQLQSILPLRLEGGERILALAEASCDRWDLHLRDAGWVAITDRRVLVAKQDSFRRHGVIDVELPVADVRYVRRHDRTNKAPVIDVITKDEDLTLKFPSWAKSGSKRAETDRFSELLASLMRLPDSEVPTVSIPGLAEGEDSAPRAIGG